MLAVRSLRTVLPRVQAPLFINSAARFASNNAPVTNDEEFFSKNARLARPMSPHLTIYQPQLTWYLSGLHRITGAGVGGAFYLAAMIYAVDPHNLTFYTDALTHVPAALAYAIKFVAAYPFAFHCFNGIRHLVWDIGAGLTMKGVYLGGWVTVALSTVTALGATLL